MQELPKEQVLIRAAKESGLREEYENDPALRNLYMHKLPKRGWAGKRTATDKKYCSLVWRATHGLPECPDLAPNDGIQGPSAAKAIVRPG